MLVITTHNGPQLVFHYPPRPKENGYQATPFTVDDDLVDSDGSTTDEEYSSDDDGSPDGETADEQDPQTLLDLLDEHDRKKAQKETKRLRQRGSKKNSVSSAKRTGSDRNSMFSTQDHASEDPVVNKVFGFDPEFLSEIMTPPKQLCNARFELTVDDIAFLGLPIHINDQGEWRAFRSKKSARSRHSNAASTNGSMTNDSAPDDSDHKSSDGADSESEEGNTMTMFHVVFVMNPPIVEYGYRIDEMFHYVVSRLSLVLRYEQAKSNYVWNEAQKILRVKEATEGRPLYEVYSKLLAESSLAAMISQCFTAISASNIANLQINDKLVSLQIPLKNQFRSILPKTTPVLPGSYLSSTCIDEDATEEEEQDMCYMAIILLDTPEKIITDLKTDSGSPLASFIENIHPTLSLQKLAQNLNFDTNQLISFAKHLIYWRRARAILPLQTRSVFIVSPMAPMSKVEENMRIFRQMFPPLPSLPSFLSLLSNSKPRQYMTIIPSKDHRDTYLDALAWLIRYGYVTQLLTFVWLKIPNRIKLAVEEDLEREGLTKRNKDNKFKFTDISTDNTSKETDGIQSSGSTVGMRRDLNGHDIIIEEEEDDDTILLDPERATAVERRWISKVIKGQPPELVAVFHKLLKHLNGKTPLELMMVKENISRHDVRRLLQNINDYIISVKHW